MTLLSNVLAGMVAFPPFIARKAKPIIGNIIVAPVPTPNPMASPFLFFPSAFKEDAFKIIRCPSTAVVEIQETDRVPARPHPLAFCALTCNSTGVPAFISTVPLESLTSLSTTARVFCVLEYLLLISEVIRTKTFCRVEGAFLQKCSYLIMHLIRIK